MFLQRREAFFVDWHPKPERGSKQRKKTATSGESISAPPRLKKGKQKAVEEDPIEFFDDLYDMDNTPETSFVERGSSRILETRTASALRMSTSISGNTTVNSDQSMEDNGESAETLYKKMLVLRNEVRIRYICTIRRGDLRQNF